MADEHGLSNDERTKCEVWTRVMGYFRPVSFFNPGKQAEHRERMFFLETKEPEGKDAASL